MFSDSQQLNGLNNYSRSISSQSDLHPEITSPVLLSTTSTLPSNLLQNIEALRQQKLEKVQVKVSVFKSKKTLQFTNPLYYLNLFLF
jgi:hypothetical protein